MGWRSQEQVQQFKNRRRKYDTDDGDSEVDEEQAPSFEDVEVKPKKKGRARRKKVYDGHVPDGLPDRFYDENGEVNLSKVPLRDALKYLTGMGFKFPFKGTGELRSYKPRPEP